MVKTTFGPFGGELSEEELARLSEEERVSREENTGPNIRILTEEERVASKKLDELPEAVDAEAAWQYGIYFREMGQWFHWKVKKLFSEDVVRIVVKLHKTERSPKGIFGKKWPPVVFVYIGKNVFTLRKKNDWFYGSPRKYWSDLIRGSDIGVGTHTIRLRAYPDTSVQSSVKLQRITVEKGARSSWTKDVSDESQRIVKATTPSLLLGGGMLLIGVVVVGLALILWSPGGQAAGRAAGGM